MALKDYLSLLPPPVPKHDKEEKRTLRRRAVSQAATGNVLLQAGRYATKEDLLARKKKVLSSP